MACPLGPKSGRATSRPAQLAPSQVSTVLSKNQQLFFDINIIKTHTFTILWFITGQDRQMVAYLVLQIIPQFGVSIDSAIIILQCLVHRRFHSFNNLTHAKTTNRFVSMLKSKPAQHY